MTHRPPQWMLDAKKIEQTCPDCLAQMREGQRQVFCLECWEYRTREMIEQARRYILIAQRKQRAVAHEEIEHDETGGYEHYKEKAIQDNDWPSVLHWKWRILVLETMGQRLPMRSFE